MTAARIPAVILKRLAFALAGVATFIVVLAHRDESTKTSRRLPGLEETRNVYEAREAIHNRISDRLPQRADLGRQRGHLFAPDLSGVALPSPVANLQPTPPAPVPPPNPYRYAGSVLHDGKFRTFITDGDRIYEVQADEKLNDQYRVAAVTKDEVVLVYTPLGSRHAIAAKWAFSSETLTIASMSVVQGSSPPALPPGSPLMAAANEPASASLLPPGSPLVARPVSN